MRLAVAAPGLGWIFVLGCTGAIGEEGSGGAGIRGSASKGAASSGGAGVTTTPGAPGTSMPGAPGQPGTPPRPGQAASPVFSCNTAASPDELPLPRLSRAELENTLRFAIALALPGDAAAIWTAVAGSFARYPADMRTPAPGDLAGGYLRTDQSIQQAAIDEMYATGQAIGQELTASAARLGAILGPCATDANAGNDRACLEGFVARWGSRVMRMPLAPEDVTYYADVAGSTPVAAVAVADVITAILNAPQTMYRVEHGTDAARDVAPLSAFETAARLSFQYWQEPPDDALWAAATSGALLTAAAFEAQLGRLFDSKKLRGSLDAFVSQWLRLEELPALDTLKNNATFKAFAGMQMPTGSTRGAMIEDVLASAYAAVTGGGSVSDFLTDRRSYATDTFLAGIYQAAPWSGSGPAPASPSAGRAGLITRAAMLATGTATTRPIHKGYLVRNALLCQQVGQPPPNVDTTPPASTRNMTTRQAVTALTSGGSCGACHESLINPPGFLTENFDALGRERMGEKLFDERGNLVATLPVDTAAAPMVVPGDTRTLASATELTRVIDESRLFHSCLARHGFRFAHRRTESPDKDGCLLAQVESTARGGAPLADVLKTYARAPSFKQRRFR